MDEKLCLINKGKYVSQALKNRLMFEKLVAYVFFIAFILSDLFSITFFQYFDEILAIICWVFLVFGLLSEKKLEIHCFFFLLLLYFLGLFSGLISPYSRSFVLVNEDFFLEMKFPLFLYFVPKIFADFNIDKKSFKVLGFISCFLSYWMLITCLKQRVLYGFERTVFYSLYAGMPALYSVLFAFFQFFLFEISKSRNRFFLLIGILSDFVICFLSESYISYFGLLLFLLFVFRQKIGAHKIGFSILFFIVLGILTYYSFYKFSSYFLNESAPRFLLMYYAFQGSVNNFPFGYGLSLYGSSIALKYYSPLYYEFGFQYTWEMRVGSPYLNDSFFPSLLGEFGFLGLICYFCLISYLFNAYFHHNKRILHFGFFCLLFLLISSFTSGFLNSSFGVIFISVLYICETYF
jgi:hypothetical protein